MALSASHLARTGGQRRPRMTKFGFAAVLVLAVELSACAKIPLNPSFNSSFCNPSDLQRAENPWSCPNP